MDGRERREPFGHSLALIDGDLEFEEQGGRQLRQVADRRNLLQALELRILTPFGTDRFNTTYGLDIQQAFAQPGGVRYTKELIRLNLVRTLGTDPRVRDVREVLFVDDPAYRDRHPELGEEELREVFRQQRIGRSWEVEVVIETIDGATHALRVTVGV
jgi:hypothetical protein